MWLRGRIGFDYRNDAKDSKPLLFVGSSPTNHAKP